MVDLPKTHIKLIGRNGDADYYELSIAGAQSKWRAFISSAVITRGRRWSELASQCSQYRACISSPAVAYKDCNA